MEKPSLIPFLLSAPGSDMLVIPVGDGQRDNAWHGALLCHRGILEAISGGTPAHTECPLWPLSSWLCLPPYVLEQGGGDSSKPEKDQDNSSTFSPVSFLFLDPRYLLTPGGSGPQLWTDHGERLGGYGRHSL
uniref:Uncharacterized protein n=1 Tax=Rousettus aegyptiacus TaxID=9407 RepID=A0A7J8GBT1_ROUAE|nr:hypothetical protein HJG63_011677 [Rousettus aegyptiacus]